MTNGGHGANGSLLRWAQTCCSFRLTSRAPPPLPSPRPTAAFLLLVCSPSPHIRPQLTKQTPKQNNNLLNNKKQHYHTTTTTNNHKQTNKQANNNNKTKKKTKTTPQKTYKTKTNKQTTTQPQQPPPPPPPIKINKYNKQTEKRKKDTNLYLFFPPCSTSLRASFNINSLST